MNHEQPELMLYGAASNAATQHETPKPEHSLGMFALSLQAPWPWSIYTQGKPVENRKWRVWKHMLGKRFIIHTSAGWDGKGYEFLEALYRQGKIDKPPTKDHTPRGALTGEATLRDCVHISQIKEPSMWQFGPWVWGLEDIVEYKVPVPCKGARGFWPVPDELVLKARAM